MNDGNPNGGTGGTVTGNGGNVMGGGRNGGYVRSWRATNGEWQWRNGEGRSRWKVVSMHPRYRLQV